jgi:hypothetical protein
MGSFLISIERIQAKQIFDFYTAGNNPPGAD